MKKNKEERKKDRAFHDRHTYQRNVPTPDDWYPPHINSDGAWFAKGTVFLEKRKPGAWVRISFWGDDDFGIEKDAEFKTLDEGLEYYHKHVSWMSKLAFVSWKDLKKLGFVNA